MQAEKIPVRRLALPALAGGAGVAVLLASVEAASRLIRMDLLGFRLAEVPIAAFAAGMLGWTGGSLVAKRLEVRPGWWPGMVAGVTTGIVWLFGWWVRYAWDLHAAGLSSADLGLRAYVVHMMSGVTQNGVHGERAIEPSEVFFWQGMQGVVLVLGASLVARAGHPLLAGKAIVGCRECGAGPVREWTLTWLDAEPEPGTGAGMSKVALANARVLLAEAASGNLSEWHRLPATPRKGSAKVQLELSTRACSSCGAGALWLRAHARGAHPQFLEEVAQVAPGFRSRALAARR